MKSNQSLANIIIFLLCSVWARAQCNLDVIYAPVNDDGDYDVLLLSNDFDGRSGTKTTSIKLASIEDAKTIELIFVFKSKTKKSLKLPPISYRSEPRQSARSQFVFSYVITGYPNCIFKNRDVLDANFNSRTFEMTWQDDANPTDRNLRNPFKIKTTEFTEAQIQQMII